jgi:hypothetical protein
MRLLKFAYDDMPYGFNSAELLPITIIAVLIASLVLMRNRFFRGLAKNSAVDPQEKTREKPIVETTNELAKSKTFNFRTLNGFGNLLFLVSVMIIFGVRCLEILMRREMGYYFWYPFFLSWFFLFIFWLVLLIVKMIKNE